MNESLSSLSKFYCTPQYIPRGNGEHNRPRNGSIDNRIDKHLLESLAIPKIISNFAKRNTERNGFRT